MSFSAQLFRYWHGFFADFLICLFFVLDKKAAQKKKKTAAKRAKERAELAKRDKVKERKKEWARSRVAHLKQTEANLRRFRRAFHAARERVAMREQDVWISQQHIDWATKQAEEACHAEQEGRYVVKLCVVFCAALPLWAWFLRRFLDLPFFF